MSLFAELKRRNVIRMAGLYLVAAWLVMEVSETLLPLFHTPEWVLQTMVVLLALGFLPALVFAWVFEMTPEGLRREGEVAPERSITAQTGRRMNRSIIVLLLIAVAYFGFDKFFLQQQREAPGTTAAAPAAQPTEAAAAASAPANSIAVLPFVNMSSDPEQEYFSDGLSEELLNQLVQIPNLRVIARTSSFSFKGKHVDVATIAKALDVGHILEGSVRRSGDTLRITAQLIRASDSSHLWSRTYDRRLTDVFRIQDEISAEVVSALKLTLLPGQTTVPQTQRTGNVEAYEHYLRGRAVLDRGTVMDGEAAAAQLRQAIDLDPDYANAWALLSFAQINLAEASQGLQERQAYMDDARASTEKAIALAPDLSDGYGSRASMRFQYDLDWKGALADLRRALELSPNGADWLTAHANFLALLGRFDQAKLESAKAVGTNPLSAFAWEAHGHVSLVAGDRDEARQAYARAIALQPAINWANYTLGYMELQDGRIDAAMAAFSRTDGGLRLAGLAMAEYARGDRAASEEALDALKDQFGAGFAFQVASVYAWRGEKDQAFAWLDKALEHRDAGLSRLRVDPTLATLRDDPRFDAMVKKVGALE